MPWIHVEITAELHQELRVEAAQKDTTIPGVVVGRLTGTEPEVRDRRRDTRKEAANEGV